MKNSDILDEAKKTLENVKASQKTLDNYTQKLEKIVLTLEENQKENEVLTSSESQIIKEHINKSKPKIKVLNKLFIIVGLLSLIVGIFSHYFAYNEIISINDNHLLFYKENNMDPFVSLNSLVFLKKVDKVSYDDNVGYFDNDKLIIKRVIEKSNYEYSLRSLNYNFEGTEVRNVSEPIYSVSIFSNFISNIMLTLSSQYLYLYLFSIIILLIGLVI